MKIIAASILVFPETSVFFESLKISPFHVLFSLPQAHRIMLGNGGVVSRAS